MKSHPVLGYSFALVTAIFAVAIIIFGFDISVPKESRRALTRSLANESTSTYFYRVDDRFALAVFTKREPGELDVSLRTYTTNYPPFCFFCGWHTDNTDDRRGFIEPYRIGSTLYDVKPLSEPYMGLPKGAHATYDLATRTFGHVMDLTAIAPDAASPTHKLTREQVSADFDEMSYYGPDDEDCQIVFAALTVAYAILFLWLLVILVRRLLAPRYTSGRGSL